jgi:hypothetical protein
VAYAKSYDVTLDRRLTVGSVELPAGNYRLVFTESTATLTNAANRKPYALPVKITTVEKKFRFTGVNSDGSRQPERLISIEVGGSNIRLEFGQ